MHLLQKFSQELIYYGYADLSGGSRPWAKGEARFFFVFACLVGFSSLCNFFTQKKGGGGGASLDPPVSTVPLHLPQSFGCKKGLEK